MEDKMFFKVAKKIRVFIYLIICSTHQQPAADLKVKKKMFGFHLSSNKNNLWVSVSWSEGGEMIFFNIILRIFSTNFSITAKAFQIFSNNFVKLPKKIMGIQLVISNEI